MSVSNSNRRRKITAVVLTVVAALVAAILALVIAVTHDADGGSDRYDTTPVAEEAPGAGFDLPLVQMQGTWSAEANGTKFLATIKNKKITIEMGDDVTTAIYWYGTFPETESHDATFNSDKVETNKIVLSGATSKVFTLEGDILSFEFEAMGVKKQIGMQRA